MGTNDEIADSTAGVPIFGGMVWSPRLIAPLLAISAAAVTVAAMLVGGPAAGALVLVIAVAAAAIVRDATRQAANAQAQLADTEAREREARLLAEAATALLASPTGPAKTLAPRMERTLAEAGARLELCHAPSPRASESALPLPMDGATGWLYVDREGPLSRDDAARLQRGLADLVRAAQERSRVGDAALDAEAGRRAELTRTALMHAIAHDLRAPVARLADASNDLRRPELQADERLDLAGAICDESGRLQRMVDDLLDLSRIDAGAVNPQPDWVDLNDVVVRAIESVRSQRGDFAVRVDLPHDLPLVHADGDQLHRVFENLVDNAAKFSPPGEVVEIRGACANGRITIRVVDKGRGIPVAQQSQVFRPFVRGRDEEGSGLGLAICRGFVEANGGRIALQAGGRAGSAFVVSFSTVSQPAPIA